jgi:hypothetical protein
METTELITPRRMSTAASWMDPLRHISKTEAWMRGSCSGWEWGKAEEERGAERQGGGGGTMEMVIGEERERRDWVCGGFGQRGRARR